VVDDALDARIVVHVPETCMAGVLQHDRCLRLFPIRALPVPCTHTSCIISLFQERPMNV
jgi:hypothetical protein